ncbi:MAG: branched-chain amino acid aminotransferase, partial [Candidatus Aenigmatarchaeota archaeon]
MKERKVYINGKLVPESKARISIFDLGFKYGAVFYESMRTFNHKIFKLEERLKRLENSLKYAGFENLLNMEEIE